MCVRPQRKPPHCDLLCGGGDSLEGWGRPGGVPDRAIYILRMRSHRSTDPLRRYNTSKDDPTYPRAFPGGRASVRAAWEVVERVVGVVGKVEEDAGASVQGRITLPSWNAASILQAYLSNVGLPRSKGERQAPLP